MQSRSRYCEQDTGRAGPAVLRARASAPAHAPTTPPNHPTTRPVGRHPRDRGEHAAARRGHDPRHPHRRRRPAGRTGARRAPAPRACGPRLTPMSSVVRRAASNRGADRLFFFFFGALLIFVLLCPPVPIRCPWSMKRWIRKRRPLIRPTSIFRRRPRCTAPLVPQASGSIVQPTPTPAPVGIQTGTPPPARANRTRRARRSPVVLRIPVGTPLAEAERLLILKTLEVADGNKQRAARILDDAVACPQARCLRGTRARGRSERRGQRCWRRRRRWGQWWRRRRRRRGAWHLSISSIAASRVLPALAWCAFRTGAPAIAAHAATARRSEVSATRLQRHPRRRRSQSPPARASQTLFRRSSPLQQVAHRASESPT